MPDFSRAKGDARSIKDNEGLELLLLLPLLLPPVLLLALLLSVSLRSSSVSCGGMMWGAEAALSDSRLAESAELFA